MGLCKDWGSKPSTDKEKKEGEEEDKEGAGGEEGRGKEGGKERVLIFSRVLCGNLSP